MDVFEKYLEMSARHLESKKKYRESIKATDDNYSYYLKDFKLRFNKISRSKTLFDPVSVDDEKTLTKYFEKLFTVNAEEIFYTDKLWIRLDILCRILQDKNNYDLIAKTGAGKTRSVLIAGIHIHKNIDENFKLLFLVPLIAIAVQLMNDTELNGNIRSIYGDITHVETKDIIRRYPIIVSTYDGLKKLIECGLNPESYVLGVDEYHNLILQQNFRRSALSAISNNVKRFKKLIRITGTPEGIIDKIAGTNIIRFIKEGGDDSLIKQQYSIMTYQKRSDEKSLTMIAQHILDNEYPGKIAVFINNTSFLETLNLNLINLGFSEQEINVVYRNENDDTTPAYTEIEKTRSIPKDVKIILCTSILNDGISIENDDISAVYFYNEYNPVIVRQFMSRFRKGFGVCFDYIPLKNDNNMVCFSDINKRFAQFKNFFNILSSNINELIDKDDITQSNGMDLLANIMGVEFKPLTPFCFDTNNMEYKYDENVIKYHLIHELHESVMKIPKLRKLYMKMYENIDCNINIVEGDAEEAISNEQRRIIIIEILEKLSINKTYIDKVKAVDLRKLKKILEIILVIKYKENPELTKLDKLDLPSIDMGNFLTNVNIILDYVTGKATIDPEIMFNELQNKIKDVQDQRELSRIFNNIKLTTKIKSGKEYSISGDWTINQAFADLFES